MITIKWKIFRVANLVQFVYAVACLLLMIAAALKAGIQM
jgi:hypothetical protein